MMCAEPTLKLHHQRLAYPAEIRIAQNESIVLRTMPSLMPIQRIIFETLLELPRNGDH